MVVRAWVGCGAFLAFSVSCGDGDPIVSNSGGAAGIDAGLVDGGAPAVDAARDSALRRCGDGVRGGAELCDDGNTLSGDGCSATCQQVEPAFVCTTPGLPCSDTSVCGDRQLSPREQCDDGNAASGDGCDASCRLERGYACRTVGIACAAAACGDTLRAGAEQCDDGNVLAADGCGTDCRVEVGYICPGDASCRKTVCGDGLVEGSEQCDDKNTRPYDGCYACQREPECQNAACVPVCGDGIKFADEACDDANTRSGDGCSSSCALEPGFSCSTVVTSAPVVITVPVLYRDLRGVDLPALDAQGIAAGHPDFERNGTLEMGIVSPRLGADKTPVYAKPDGSSGSTTSAQDFRSWYHDDPRLNRLVSGSISFGRAPNGDYVYNDTQFFPLDNLGFMAEGAEAGRNNNHNFSFTSELRTWFEYRGGETLDFEGDDDVWVFINGRLAVDLGGIHAAAAGAVTLSPENATAFGLSVGSIYELSVFQAERHTDLSKYKLTLRSFDKAVTECRTVCGNAVVTPDELCDDGKNDGSYGSCMPGCQGFAPSCGDGLVQSAAGEECDDGNRQPGDGCDNGCRAFIVQ